MLLFAVTYPPLTLLITPILGGAALAFSYGKRIAAREKIAALGVDASQWASSIDSNLRPFYATLVGICVVAVLQGLTLRLLHDLRFFFDRPAPQDGSVVYKTVRTTETMARVMPRPTPLPISPEKNARSFQASAMQLPEDRARQAQEEEARAALVRSLPPSAANMEFGSYADGKWHRHVAKP